MSDSENAEPPERFVFPPDYALCIAEITAFWATIEANIDMSIWHLAGIYPGVGACITAQIFDLQSKLRALVALLKLRDAPKGLLSRVNRFGERVRTAQDIRNRVIHDQWFHGAESKAVTRLEITARGTPIFNFKDVPLLEFQTDRDKVREAMIHACAIRDEVEASLPTLPEIPMKALHPTVLRGRGHEQTRSIDETFLLFPPKPSVPSLPEVLARRTARDLETGRS